MENCAHALKGAPAKEAATSQMPIATKAIRAARGAAYASEPATIAATPTLPPTSGHVL